MGDQFKLGEQTGVKLERRRKPRRLIRKEKLRESQRHYKVEDLEEDEEISPKETREQPKSRRKIGE